jgi:hypothetical protein
MRRAFRICFRPLVLRGLAFSVLLASPSRAADDTALRLTNVNSGQTGYVRVADDAALEPQTFTLEAWVQRMGAGYGFTTDPSGAAIIAKPRENVSGSNIASWHLHWTQIGQIHFNLTHTLGSSGVYLLTPAVATPLAKHHVAVTFDGAKIRAFIDGAFSAEANWSLGTVYYGADDVLIGADNFSLGYYRRFDGFIDDVRIWDHARSEAEIAAQMNCRLSGTESGLVAYWTFDESDLSDLTGHGHGGGAVGTAGAVAYAALAPISSCAVGVDDLDRSVASDPVIQVFPHPMTSQRATVMFDLPRDGWVTLELFDVAGRRRAILAAQHYAQGRHEWDGDLQATSGAGVFFLRLRFEDRTGRRGSSGFVSLQ